MGSPSARNPGAEGVGRRTLIKRSAALGLACVPATGLVSTCASGGGGDDSSDDTQGRTSKDSPFGVKDGSKPDVVIFEGGYGDDYAKAWEAAFRKKWGVTSTRTGTQEITGRRTR
ncbi:hypothetical protein [Streptomyces cinereospinus]|uniref:Uncharacterized protein n=1 Tax=Streptomyces cinereospinus TaxID=285561 RepID=A0ABV5NAX7_9ACTN